MASTSMTAQAGRAGATVLVAGRREAARAAIAGALEGAGFRVCAQCPDAASAVEAVARSRPDVCLVDIDLPGGGLTTVRAVVTQHMTTRVIVLASAARPIDLFAALRAGAVGYVLTDIEADGLPAEIDAVLNGRAALSRELTAELITEFRALSTTSVWRGCGTTPVTDPRRSKQ